MRFEDAGQICACVRACVRRARARASVCQYEDGQPTTTQSQGSCLSACMTWIGLSGLQSA